MPRRRLGWQRAGVSPYQGLLRLLAPLDWQVSENMTTDRPTDKTMEEIRALEKQAAEIKAMIDAKYIELAKILIKEIEQLLKKD